MASGSEWNLWVWLAGAGCGWNLWCVASGYGCKEVYKFPHIIYSYSCICFFQQHPYLFCSFFKMFFVLVQFFVVIYIIFSRSINTYGRPPAAI